MRKGQNQQARLPARHHKQWADPKDQQREAWPPSPSAHPQEQPADSRTPPVYGVSPHSLPLGVRQGAAAGQGQESRRLEGHTACRSKVLRPPGAESHHRRGERPGS